MNLDSSYRKFGIWETYTYNTHNFKTTFIILPISTYPRDLWNVSTLTKFHNYLMYLATLKTNHELWFLPWHTSTHFSPIWEKYNETHQVTQHSNTFGVFLSLRWAITQDVVEKQDSSDIYSTGPAWDPWPNWKASWIL